MILDKKISVIVAFLSTEHQMNSTGRFPEKKDSVMLNSSIAEPVSYCDRKEI
jgi:hypothetical protein